MTFETLKKWKYTFATNVLIVTRDESPLVYRAPDASEHSHFGTCHIGTSTIRDCTTALIQVTMYRQFARKVGTSANKAVRQSPDLLFIATSFWFEESPSAVRTNTAGLGRLCTLFVCSTLVDFEHTHAVLSSTLVLCCTMVTTSTAAMSNSRYADTDRMKNGFLIRFSKPHLDRTKAGR